LGGTFEPLFICIKVALVDPNVHTGRADTAQQPFLDQPVNGRFFVTKALSGLADGHWRPIVTLRLLGLVWGRKEGRDVVHLF
jgi:hypothetical protein